LLSSNWLVRRISQVYVEVLRNTPLLVQLFVWYFVVMFSLPVVQQAITLPIEGVAAISLRVPLYVALYIAVSRYVRRFGPDAPARMAVLAGALAAVILTEAAFWLHRTQASWAAAYGSGDVGNTAFLIYLAMSALLVAAAWYAPSRWRATALGAALGQLAAGLLFYFGVTPDSALRIELYPVVYLSVRGFVFPSLLPTARFGEWMAFVGLGFALAVIAWIYFGRVIETTGRDIPRGWYTLLAFAGFASWVATGRYGTRPAIIGTARGTTVYDAGGGPRPICSGRR
jgi:hypothetical protein